MRKAPQGRSAGGEVCRDLADMPAGNAKAGFYPGLAPLRQCLSGWTVVSVPNLSGENKGENFIREIHSFCRLSRVELGKVGGVFGLVV